MYSEIIIAGYGGQGVLVLGEVLAIGNIKNGGKSTWLPAYGAAMRGGTANCSVVLSDEEIGSPMVEEPDILVCFNQPSLVKFSPQLAPGGVIFANDDAIDSWPELREDIGVVKVKAQSIALELGNERCINTVMLGAVLKRCPLITLERAQEALSEIWGEERSARLMPVNSKALRAGYDSV